MNVAPPCPDCGQPCRHPLMLPVTCPCCGGKPFVLDPLDTYGYPPSERIEGLSDCTQCLGKREVDPPLPTDEQIFGRPCEACNGAGATVGPLTPASVRVRKDDEDPTLFLFKADLARCFDCNGTGRVGAAENRWTCLGGVRYFKGEERLRREGRQVHNLPCAPFEEHSECWTECSGRTDVVAEPAVWAEAVRQWRTREKTTVREVYCGISSIYDLLEHEHDELVPVDVSGDGRGRVTITIRFQPE